MIDELTLYNLSVKYPNTVDLVREVEKMARIEMSENIRCEDNCLECKIYNHEKFYCPKWCSVIKNTIADARADEREHILEILHGIDRQIENLVICVLASECNEELKKQKKCD